jgi:hypothetical protein
MLRIYILLVILLATPALAQVPTFEDTFDGPALDPAWTAIQPASHPGFNGSGRYVVDGVLSSSSGLRRGMGGQGSFIAEVSLELGPFLLTGSGGTKSDFKFRFGGSSGNVEVVLNSFQNIRVHSAQLGGNIAQTSLSSLSDGDRLDLQLSFLDVDGSVDVKVAINGGPWVDLASATGIVGDLDGNSDIVFFKFGNNPTTLPQMRLDRYEVRAIVGPIARPDVYQTPQDTLLMVPAPGVLTNDTHAFALPMSAVLVSNASPDSVMLSTNGGFNYQPPAGYSGPDSFIHHADDGTTVSAPTIVLLGVTPPPSQIVDFEVLSPGAGQYRIEWGSSSEKVYGIEGATNMQVGTDAARGPARLAGHVEAREPAVPAGRSL